VSVAFPAGRPLARWVFFALAATDDGLELRPVTGEQARRLGSLDQEDAGELQQLLARQQALDRMRIWMLESGLESIHYLHDRAGEDVFPGSPAGKKC
jgi:hypothetical protein